MVKFTRLALSAAVMMAPTRTAGIKRGRAKAGKAFSGIDNSGDGGAVGGGGSDSFGPAISLGSFSALDRSIELRDGSFFEWVNKEEIKAGETTCGFLHAPLSWPNAEETMAFPGVKVCEYYIP